MFFIITSLLFLVSFAKNLSINDFFSKDICTISIENINQKKNVYIKRRKKVVKKSKRICKKTYKKVVNEKDIKNYYLVDARFKRKYKAAIAKYKNKYYLMINEGFYKEKDFIEDYLIYKISLDKVILKKEEKYYIWML